MSSTGLALNPSLAYNSVLKKALQSNSTGSLSKFIAASASKNVCKAPRISLLTKYNRALYHPYTIPQDGYSFVHHSPASVKLLPFIKEYSFSFYWDETPMRGLAKQDQS